MRNLSLRIAATFAAATLLAACGGSGDDESNDEPSTSVEAASGEQVETDDFSFTAPADWIDVTNEMPGFDPEAAWAESEPNAETFATNVNVVREPNPFDGSAEDYTDANIEALEQAGYGNPTKDGTFGDFVVVTAEAQQGGTTFLVNQYYAVQDDQGWVVTFSFADDTSDDARTELAESVMQTWEWA